MIENENLELTPVVALVRKYGSLKAREIRKLLSSEFGIDVETGSINRKLHVDGWRHGLRKNPTLFRWMVVEIEQPR